MWTPDLTCSLTNTLNFELAKICLSAAYTGRRYTDNMNLYYLKPYVLVNLAVTGAEIRGHFQPYLKADNLLNWHYQSVEGYSMPGISLTLGGRYQFF
jgi:outer membrane cobalamin receptor